MISNKLKEELKKEGFWVHEYEGGKINTVSCIKVKESSFKFAFPHEHVNDKGKKMAGGG